MADSATKGGRVIDKDGNMRDEHGNVVGKTVDPEAARKLEEMSTTKGAGLGDLAKRLAEKRRKEAEAAAGGKPPATPTTAKPDADADKDKDAAAQKEAVKKALKAKASTGY